MDKPKDFLACKSYKKGRYIFGKYKKFDFFIIVLTILISGFMISTSKQLRQGISSSLLLCGVVFVLLAPDKKYHAIYYQAYYMVRRIINSKTYIYKGVDYGFRQINKQAEQDVKQVSSQRKKEKNRKL